MSDDAINDLKQFISAEIYHNTSDIKSTVVRIEDRLDKVENRLGNVEHRLDEIHLTIEQSVFPYITEVDNQVQVHDRRIKALERKTA